MDQDQPPSSYASAGVDEEREQDVFARAMRPWLARTKVQVPAGDRHHRPGQRLLRHLDAAFRPGRRSR